MISAACVRDFYSSLSQIDGLHSTNELQRKSAPVDPEEINTVNTNRKTSETAVRKRKLLVSELATLEGTATGIEIVIDDRTCEIGHIRSGFLVVSIGWTHWSDIIEAAPSHQTQSLSMECHQSDPFLKKKVFTMRIFAETHFHVQRNWFTSHGPIEFHSYSLASWAHSVR